MVYQVLLWMRLEALDHLLLPPPTTLLRSQVAAWVVKDADDVPPLCLPRETETTPTCKMFEKNAGWWFGG